MNNNKKLFLLVAAIIVAYALVFFFGPRPVDAHCRLGCYTPSPTATPTPTPTPSPTFNPCEQEYVLKFWNENPCPTDTPSASPSATPSDNPGGQPLSDSFSAVSAPQGPACETIDVAPTVTTFSRNNPWSIHIGWTGSNSFVHDYVIQYGLANGVPLWNTVVTNAQSTDLNFLPFNHVLWVRAAGTQNGCVGPYGAWIDP